MYSACIQLDACMFVAVLIQFFIVVLSSCFYILCEQRCSACMLTTSSSLVVRTRSTERMARLDGDGCELGELCSLLLMTSINSKTVLAVDGRKFENSVQLGYLLGAIVLLRYSCCLKKYLAIISVMCCLTI